MSHALQSPSTEVAPGIHRLTGGVSNFYLVEQSGGLTLVDAGTPGDWRLFLRTLDGLGRRLDDLDAVVLTHAHPDHVGFAERARREGPASVWVHNDDAAVAQGAKPGKNDAGLVKYLARTELYRTMISLSRRKGAKSSPSWRCPASPTTTSSTSQANPGQFTPPGTHQATPRCTSRTRTP